jgi:hypothetical protein
MDAYCPDCRMLLAEDRGCQSPECLARRKGGMRRVLRTSHTASLLRRNLSPPPFKRTDEAISEPVTKDEE